MQMIMARWIEHDSFEEIAERVKSIGYPPTVQLDPAGAEAHVRSFLGIFFPKDRVDWMIEARKRSRRLKTTGLPPRKRAKSPASDPDPSLDG